jgi:DNA primase
MNITEAKKTHLMDYLHLNGHSPVKIRYSSAWFLSPIRQEREPSFKVHLFKNVWYDFGTGEGGNLIDLVMKLHNVNLPDALELIGKNSYTVGEHKVGPSDESEHIKISRIYALTNTALIQYLNSRNVSLHIAQTFLKEAYYTVHEGRYFALAFGNDKGGYELRNAYFKTGSSPKYFTTIPGVDDSKINVFEGFMDFLSCCTLYNRIPKSRTIVLNSLSFLPKIESKLKEAEEVNLFLDNDPAGRTATYKIIKKCGKGTDWAPVIYPDHKDFNEFLMKRRIQ